VNKISSCYGISRGIVDYYNELEHIAILYGKNHDKFKELIKRIKKEVSVEYDCYSMLSYRDISLGNSRLSVTDNYSIRFKSKLDNTLYILGGPECSISGTEIEKHTNIPSSMKFSIPDITCAIPEIEALCLINDQLSDLRSTCDRKFMIELTKQHWNYMVYYFSLRSFSEMLALNYKFDINKIKKLYYHNILIDLIANKTNNRKLEEVFTDMALLTVKILSNMNVYENNAESYYAYIFYTTILKVYLSYLEKEQLKVFSEKCKQYKVKDEKVKESLTRILSKPKEEQ